MGLIGNLIQMLVSGGLDFGFNQLGNYMQNRGADQAIQDYYKAIQPGQTTPFALPSQGSLQGLPGLNYPNVMQPSVMNIPQGAGGQLTARMANYPELIKQFFNIQNRPAEQAQELEKQLYQAYGGGIGKNLEERTLGLDISQGRRILQGREVIPREQLQSAYSEGKGLTKETELGVGEPYKISAEQRKLQAELTKKRTPTYGQTHPTVGGERRVSPTEINALDKEIIKFGEEYGEYDPDMGTTLTPLGQQLRDRGMELLGLSKTMNVVGATKKAKVEIEKEAKALLEQQTIEFRKNRQSQTGAGGYIPPPITDKETRSPTPSGITNDPQIQKRIMDAKKQGISIQRIKDDLKAKGVNPDIYTY